jgi:PhzF family phenazine biosynthesis protein
MHSRTAHFPATRPPSAFTPATEVDLCGHATLAAAHTLIEQNLVSNTSPIGFQTRSGELICTKSGSRITLNFPATPAHDKVDSDTASEVLATVGLRNATVLQTRFDLVIVLNDAEIVRTLRPDFNAMQQIETRGVMVTAPGNTSGVDFISRFFAPRCGINEDPVTGSAHCCLAPYWGERLSKTTLVGYQASARGGTVYCEVAADRVLLTGSAVTVLEGRIMVDSD